MWLITPFGFFSVVQKDPTGQGRLCVRSRNRADLNRLRTEYLPQLSVIEYSHIADYPWRGYCTHRQLGQAMAKIAQDIDYENFKTEVERQQGRARHDVYTRVWVDLLALERL